LKILASYFSAFAPVTNQLNPDRGHQQIAQSLNLLFRQLIHPAFEAEIGGAV